MYTGPLLAKPVMFQNEMAKLKIGITELMLIKRLQVSIKILFSGIK